MWRKFWIVEAVFLGIGALISWLFANDPVARPMWPSGIAILGLIPPLIVASLTLALFIHELGHFAAARLVGFKVVSFDVFELSLVRRKKPRPKAKGIWGGVGVETTLAQDRPVPWRILILAGPLVSLFLVGLSFVAYRSDSPPWQLFGLVEGLINLNLVQGSLTVKRGRLPATDFEMLLDVGRSDSHIFSNNALHRIMSLAKPANPEDIRRALMITGPENLVTATFYACRHAMLSGSGTAEMTANYRNSCKAAREAGGPYAASETLTIFTQDAILESSFCAAFFDKDLSTANSYFESLDVLYSSVWFTARRVDAALTWLEGEVSAAQEKISRAKSIVDKIEYPDFQEMIDLERRLLSTLEVTIRQGL